MFVDTESYNTIVGYLSSRLGDADELFVIVLAKGSVHCAAKLGAEPSRSDKIMFV